MEYSKESAPSRKELFTTLFKELTALGYFKDDFNAELQQLAFYNIFIISDSWIRYHFIVHNQKPDKETIKYHSRVASSILLSYIQNSVPGECNV